MGDTNVPAFEDVLNRLVDLGWAFLYHELHTAAVATNNTLSFLITTGAREFHLTRFQFTSDVAPGKIQLIEAPTITAAGAAKAFKNKNRTLQGVMVAAAAIEKDPTFTPATGDDFDGDLIAGTKQSGGGSSKAREIILKANTTYLVVYTNLAVSSTSLVDVNIEGHEHFENA